MRDAIAAFEACGFSVGPFGIGVDTLAASASIPALEAYVAAVTARPAGRAVYYLSGPMTGQPGNGVPAFTAAAAALRARGLRLVVPHEVTGELAAADGDPAAWPDLVRADLRAMLDCDGIILLEGWQGSRGARLELTVAAGLGWPAWPVASIAKVGRPRESSSR